MFQQKLSAVFEVAIDDMDHRLSEVCQSSQEFLLHALPISIRDFINPAFGVVGINEELMLVTELFVEKRVDERDVVMNSPGFEDLFACPGPDDLIPIAFGHANRRIRHSPCRICPCSSGLRCLSRVRSPACKD